MAPPRIKYIYMITCVITGKSYVGQTYSVHGRMIEHKSKGNRKAYYEKYPLYKDIHKYTIDSFYLEVLNKAPDTCAIDLLEDYYITKYNTDKNGYNLIRGGRNANKLSAMSDEDMEEWVDKTTSHFKKQVVQYSLSGDFIAIHNSIKDAKNALGYDDSKRECIGDCARMKAKSSLGYQWRFLNDDGTYEDKISAYHDKREDYKHKHPGNKKVYQYSKDGTFIKEYGSVKDAVNEMKLQTGKSYDIGACARGKIKTAGGYIWSYIKKEETGKNEIINNH